MTLAVTSLALLLALAGGPAAATLVDERNAVDLFAGLPVPFVVEGVEDGEAGRVLSLRSSEPVGRNTAGALYLRATLTISGLGDADPAAEIERRLAAADPDIGLSYAWDYVAAGGGPVFHLHAGCTFSEESFRKVARALAARLAGAGGDSSASFWCRCGGGCRAGAPFADDDLEAVRIPPVRRPPGVEEGDYDNRLDPSGTWTSAIGELSLMHYANRLAFSYLAVFGATAHICEGAGIAGLVGTDRYEYVDDQGTIAFTLTETEVRMEPTEGVASFCGAGWPGDRFTTESLEPPDACAVAAEHTHLHVTDTLDLERTPFTLGRGSRVEAVPALHTGDEKWVLGRSVGPLTTRMGMLPRSAIACPTADAEPELGRAPTPLRDPHAVFTLAGGPASPRVTLARLASRQTGEEPAATSEPAIPDRQPSLRYRIKRWLLPVGVFLMAMAILGFLAVAALFAPPFWAWFIYLFLLPFLVWMPGMTLHPAAGWPLAAAWLIAFPVLRRWLYTTPSGKRWLARQRRRLARFEGGDPAAARWRVPWSSGSPGSAARGGRTSSGFSGRGGRFGGGGGSSRW